MVERNPKKRSWQVWNFGDAPVSDSNFFIYISCRVNAKFALLDYVFGVHLLIIISIFIGQCSRPLISICWTNVQILLQHTVFDYWPILCCLGSARTPAASHSTFIIWQLLFTPHVMSYDCRKRRVGDWRKFRIYRQSSYIFFLNWRSL